jgi:hypothetical protein
LAFDSALLGVAVPSATVLELAGLLAKDDLDAVLRVEHVRPWVNAVLTFKERRFDLVLNQPRIEELCRQPHCPHAVRYPDTWCRDHLHERTVEDLVELAREWGHWRYEEADEDPDRYVGPGAEPLIHASVTQGCINPVRETLLRHSFPDSLFEDDYFEARKPSPLQRASPAPHPGASRPNSPAPRTDDRPRADQ